MPPRETPASRIERLLAAGDLHGALQAANELLAQSPNSFLGRFGRARANLRLGDDLEGARDLDIAATLAPNDDHLRFVRARIDFRNGKTDEAIEVLSSVVRRRGPHALEASFALLDAYFYANRAESLAAMVEAGGLWDKDPRTALHVARVRAMKDRDAGIDALLSVYRSALPVAVRRFAGFEAAGLLDKAARYREAFDLISNLHATTSGPIEIESWTAPLAAQERAIEKIADKVNVGLKPRGDCQHGVAFVVALPRSGTTLLEHMLDRHPQIGGIGEFRGLNTIQHALSSADAWPFRGNAVPNSIIDRLRSGYISSARQICKDGASWTFDKSLMAWRMLPEISVCFPSAVCLAIDRDPRDNATSIFLSHLNPATHRWVGSFSAIRKIVSWQRRIVPRTLEILGISHESIMYEDLIEDPARHATRCLARMGLPMDSRVLSPESSEKTAATLSHAQVRQPINRSSIGRWKNYAWAFDGSWDELTSAHEARLALSRE
jgi:hypothetical protein